MQTLSLPTIDEVFPDLGSPENDTEEKTQEYDLPDFDGEVWEDEPTRTDMIARSESVVMVVIDRAQRAAHASYAAGVSA